MNYSEFNARFPEGTETGRDITEDVAAYYHDNGKDVGIWRVDRRSTTGKGEILTTENSHIARHYYREKSSSSVGKDHLR